MLTDMNTWVIVVLILIGGFALGKLLNLVETAFGLAVLVGIALLIWKYFIGH